MKHSKQTRMHAVAVLLLLCLLLSIFVGCAQPPETPSGETPPGETPPKTPPEEPPIQLTATRYLQGGLPVADTLGITVDEGRVYIDGVLYDKILYTTAVSPTFSAQLQAAAASDASKAALLQQLSEQESCYLLEAVSDATGSPRGVAYILDNVYYLLWLNDTGEVYAIHAAATEETIELATIDFTTSIYIDNLIAISSYHKLEASISNGRLYVGYNENKTAWEKIVYAETFVFSENIIDSLRIDDMAQTAPAVYDLFETLKTHKGCYLLYGNNQSLDEMPGIIVYDIDGVYYFFAFSNSAISQICSANTRMSAKDAQKATSTINITYTHVPKATMTLAIIDSHIYVNNIEYDKLTQISKFTPYYMEGLTFRDGLFVSSSTKDWLDEHLPSCTTFYILQTSNTTTLYGEQIVACKIKDDWTFFCLNADGSVVEIYMQR